MTEFYYDMIFLTDFYLNMIFHDRVLLQNVLSWAEFYYDMIIYDRVLLRYDIFNRVLF